MFVQSQPRSMRSARKGNVIRLPLILGTVFFITAATTVVQARQEIFVTVDSVEASCSSEEIQRVYLLDASGEVVHQWASREPNTLWKTARLLPGGDLGHLRTQTCLTRIPQFNRQFAWHGNIFVSRVLGFDDHHDSIVTWSIVQIAATCEPLV